MTIALDDSTIKYVSEENTFYVGQKGKSPTTKTATFIQGLHRFGSHASFPTAHVTKSLLNENPIDLKTKQKYQMLIPRKGNPDSDKDGPFLKDYTAKFRSKSPSTMTHSLTDGNRKFSPKFPDDLTLRRGTLSGNDIIILPEGKGIDHINAPDPESTETVGASRTFPDEITELTLSTTPITSKGPLYRTKVTFTGLYDQRKPTMSPMSEYNQDKIFKAESYHSQDATVPSATFKVNLDNELSFFDEDFENTKSRASTSSSSMKTIHPMADTTAPSLENSYEGGDSMQPDENNVRPREFPFLPTTESIILMPKVLTEDSVPMSNNSLTDSSKSVSVISETVSECLGFIHGNDISENQDIKIQTDLQPHSLDSSIPSINSITFTRNSTDNKADSSSTVKRETVNISKAKKGVQSLGTTMEVLSPRRISPFSSEIRKTAKLSAEEDTAAKFDLSHITNATVLIPTLEKTLPSTPVNFNTNAPRSMIYSLTNSRWIFYLSF